MKIKLNKSLYDTLMTNKPLVISIFAIIDEFKRFLYRGRYPQKLRH